MNALVIQLPFAPVVLGWQEPVLCSRARRSGATAAIGTTGTGTGRPGRLRTVRRGVEIGVASIKKKPGSIPRSELGQVGW